MREGSSSFAVSLFFGWVPDLLAKVKNRILGSWSNLRGLHTRRRLVVFDSDDWGAIRMRDPAAFEELVRHGLQMQACAYDRLDCIESGADLEHLFNVLSAFLDKTGRPPVFTFNTIMGNPDFDAIKASDFTTYVHEPFPKSYLRYRGEDLEPLWRNASREKIIQPQFHGREHVNVGLWMRDLQQGHPETRSAFEYDYYGLTTITSAGRRRDYLAAHWPAAAGHLEPIRIAITEGLGLFETTFGFPSRSFIACNYVWPDELEGTLAEHGVRLLKGQRGQIRPSADGRKVSIRRPYTGQRNHLGQWYAVRNVLFEPFEDSAKDWVSSALGQISDAFLWRKPAIISTHRVNYVGGMDLKHRDRSLRLLNELIGKILVRWPDVEFISADELIDVMQH